MLVNGISLTMVVVAALGGVAFFSIVGVVIKSKFLVALIPIWLGLCMYILRSRHRLAYGILELVIAVGFLMFSFYHLAGAIVFHSSPTGVIFVASAERRYTALIAAAGAVYVFVRGMDNIGEGLKPYPKALAWWRWILCLGTT
jgi:hypothetical protein